MNIQGLLDEIESASIAICALTDALSNATVFEHAGIEAALKEASESYFNASIELLSLNEK